MIRSLRCVSCGEPIRAENINIQEMVAKCSQCHAVFSFRSVDESIQTVDPYAAALAEVLPADEPLEKPPHLDIEAGYQELRIGYRWRDTRNTSFFVVFTLIWCGILIPFIATAIATNSLELVAFISLHLIVGVSMALYTSALLFNRTNILVSHQGIVVEHGPIPVPFTPNRTLESRVIKQLYVEEYVPSRTNGKPDYTYAVRAVQHDGSELRLVGGFNSSHHARYVEKEIEKFLGIADAQ